MELFRWKHTKIDIAIKISTGFLDYCIIDYAAVCCHLDIVKFLHYNRIEGCTTDAMDYAAEYGHLDIVKLLQNNRKDDYT